MAYEEIIKELKTNESFSQFTHLLKKAVLESNQVALETAIDAVLLYVTNAPDACSTKDLVPYVVEKCLSAMKAGTRAKSCELLLMYVEIDSSPEHVIVFKISFSFRYWAFYPIKRQKLFQQ